MKNHILFCTFEPQNHNRLYDNDNRQNMEIYHGGYCPIKTPEIIKGKYAKDFGSGFYCTELKEQAIRWAIRNVVKLRCK